MKLVIFDLDGTLTPQRPSSTAAFEQRLREGIVERCRVLLDAGHVLTIATNQGGVARGLAAEAVEEHLDWVCRELGIVATRVAWEAARKKPSPVMLLELMEEFRAEPGGTWFVGDSEADELAATAAGVRFVHVDTFVANGLG